MHTPTLAPIVARLAMLSRLPWGSERVGLAIGTAIVSAKWDHGVWVTSSVRGMAALVVALTLTTAVVLAARTLLTRVKASAIGRAELVGRLHVCGGERLTTAVSRSMIRWLLLMRGQLVWRHLMWRQLVSPGCLNMMIPVVLTGVTN